MAKAKKKTLAAEKKRSLWDQRMDGDDSQFTIRGDKAFSDVNGSLVREEPQALVLKDIGEQIHLSKQMAEELLSQLQRILTV